jgi:hypothetical protein
MGGSSFDAVLVVLVIVAPVVALVGIRLGLHPFLRLRPIDVGLKRGCLASRVCVLRLPISEAHNGEHAAMRMQRRRLTTAM